jgi:DNA-binding beta-propeller fold protein YncE
MIKRRTLLSLLAAAGLPLPALAATPPLCIVMNSGDATISLIDMGSHQVIGTVPAFREPSHWALTPDHSKLYVCDASGNALFILDPRTGAELGHVQIADPYQLAYTPDQKYLVVNALRINHVDVYDAGTLALVKRFTAGKMPSHLDFSPDSRWSFNSMQDSGTLVSFDLTDMTKRWTTKVGDTPAGVLWLHGKVLCCIMGRDEVVELDPETGAIGRRVKTGEGAHNLFLSPDRSVLYVSNRLGGTLSALDPVSLAVQRTYQVPGGPDDIGIAPDGKIWIALRFAEAVAVMDPVSGTYTSIPVGRSPHGIFLSTDLDRTGKVTAEML